MPASAGARSRATRYLTDAVSRFSRRSGAAPDLAEARQALAEQPGGGDRRLRRRRRWTARTRSSAGSWMPPCMPALLAREGATALLEACDAQAAVVFTSGRQRTGAGGLVGRAATRRAPGSWRWAPAAPLPPAPPRLVPIEPLGRDPEGPRFALVSSRADRSRAVRGSAFARSARCCARDSISAPPATARSRRPAAFPSARSSRSCRDSSARAPRCSASPSRFSACRATTSPCSSPARAGPARISSRARSTPARRAAAACSCPTTARARRASSPTASCSATAAAASRAPIADQPGVLRTARRRHAVPRRSRRPAARRPAQTAAVSRAG